MRNATATRRIYIAAGSLVVGSLLLIFAARAGSILVENDPQRSDVILVLAGETDRRPARALELLDQGYASLVILDVPADARIFGETDIQLAERYVQNLPRAASVHICAIEGLSTKAESHDAEKCLARENADRVLIVTSDYHTRRALSIFRREIPGKSFSVAAATDEEQFGEHYWTHRQWAKTCFDEWLKWFWWNVVDRWR